jgi:salicylate hydroxylase
MAAGRLSAIVAGGGIGGLATAIALARRGVAVRVCERRAEFPEAGAGIQIGPNGTRILKDLGVDRFLADRAATPDVLIVHEGTTGRELTRLPLGTWIAERHGAPYLTTHRRDLHQALRACAESIPEITLSRDAEIAACKNDADGVTATLANGEAFDASMLIAADGLWSTLRADISGEAAALRPHGKTTFRSVTDAPSLPPSLVQNAVHIWLLPGVHAVHYPVNGGRDIAIVVIADALQSNEGWDDDASAEQANEAVKTFAAPLRALIEGATQWRRWSLYGMTPLGRWTAGRAALLGDAAHPMLPFLAQGAVMALEDAVTLSACISDCDDVSEALQRYEQSRRTRVAKVVERSLRNGRIYHMQGPAAFARNTVMKLQSPERIMSGFDWLYGWKVPGC